LRRLVIVCMAVVFVLGAYELTLGTVHGTVKGVPCVNLPPTVCQKPMANVTIRFEAEIGGGDSESTTKSDGTFTIRLAPGKYRIDIVSIGNGHLLEGPHELVLWPFTDNRIDLLVPSGLQ
jgi:hypothetical protein